MGSNKIAHDSDYLDFSKLEAEVEDAVVSEERYWRENNAKIRAVEQRVPTYEDFREIVLAAHLKPLENKDKISSIGKFTQVWNQSAQKFTSCPSKKEGTNSNDNAESSTLEKDSVIKLPKSGAEFVLHWRRHCMTADERKQFLFTIGAKGVAKLFRTEIGDLLGEFLVCLHCLEDNESAQAVELLQALTESQRFSLSLAFLSKNERKSCQLLFDKLKESTYVKDSASVQQSVAILEDLFRK